MTEIEKYARAAASTARTPPNSPARHAAIEAENATRVAAEQFAANREQRIADLETKCGTLKRLHDAVAAERDELRARLAEIDGQEPVAWMPYWGLGRMIPHPFAFIDKSSAELIASQIKSNTEVRPLYVRPVPAIPDGEPLTCDVCGVVCAAEVGRRMREGGR